MTPCKLVAMANFTEGHLPVGFGDIAHIHPLFVMNPLAQPDPNQVKETTPVAPAEMAADHLKIEDIAGGIGQAYQDPTEPQAKANWYGIGYNYFYIAGHMNAVAAGATSTWLNDRQAGGTLTRSLKQPLVYPRPGYYPRTFTAYYDTTKKVWVFALRDFIAATRWVGNP